MLDPEPFEVTDFLLRLYGIGIKYTGCNIPKSGLVIFHCQLWQNIGNFRYFDSRWKRVYSKEIHLCRVIQTWDLNLVLKDFEESGILTI